MVVDYTVITVLPAVLSISVYSRMEYSLLIKIKYIKKPRLYMAGAFHYNMIGSFSCTAR